MNTLTKGDILSLQHSVHTANLGYEKLFYNLEYIQTIALKMKAKEDFFRPKNQQRYQYALQKFKETFREFKVDLLNSIPYENRYLILESHTEESIQALNSIDMLVNQIRDADALETLENHISEIIRTAKQDAEQFKKEEAEKLHS